MWFNKRTGLWELNATTLEYANYFKTVGLEPDATCWVVLGPDSAGKKTYNRVKVDDGLVVTYKGQAIYKGVVVGKVADMSDQLVGPMPTQPKNVVGVILADRRIPHGALVYDAIKDNAVLTSDGNNSFITMADGNKVDLTAWAVRINQEMHTKIKGIRRFSPLIATWFKLAPNPDNCGYAVLYQKQFGPSETPVGTYIPMYIQPYPTSPETFTEDEATEECKRMLAKLQSVNTAASNISPTKH